MVKVGVCIIGYYRAAAPSPALAGPLPQNPAGGWGEGGEGSQTRTRSSSLTCELHSESWLLKRSWFSFKFQRVCVTWRVSSGGLRAAGD